jgi:hypothetical protein
MSDCPVPEYAMRSTPRTANCLGADWGEARVCIVSRRDGLFAGQFNFDFLVMVGYCIDPDQPSRVGNPWSGLPTRIADTVYELSAAHKAHLFRVNAYTCLYPAVISFCARK